MPIVYDADYVKQAVQIAVGQIDSTLEGIDTAMGDSAVDAGRPSAADIAALFFMKQQEFTAATYTYPGTGMTCPACGGSGQTMHDLTQTPQQCPNCAGTGQVKNVVTGSPWILMMDFAENGKDFTAPFNRFVARNSGGI